MEIADWLNAIKAAESKTVDPVPDGWITRAEFQAMTGCCESSAKKRLSQLVACGLAEQRLFRIKRANDTFRVIPHFKLRN